MSTEQELRTHRCCFTGHRPEKLRQSEKEITARLKTTIRAAVNDGFVTFISGMARGVDIWAAETVLRLRDMGAAVHLICAIPYQGFEKSWAIEWQRRYSHILRDADLVRYICPSYSRDCFQKRNEWMVNHSARVIAVYNGESGGTRNTVRYATNHGISIVNLCEEFSDV